ncbi:MAG: ROK family protein, partial [Candidatus Poribacteria bacterium]
LDYLAIAIVNVAELFNPELIVLGGNIVQGGDFVIQHLSKRFEELDFDFLNREIELKFSKLGIYAGSLGAANFALERAFEPSTLR